MLLRPQPAHEATLAGLVTSSDRLMRALKAVRALGLNSWCIGAGAVRSLVWDALHGHERPSDLDDVDVVYFDDAPCARGQDPGLERRLSEALPQFRWEVTNQATVHEWFAEKLGQLVPPVHSLEEGVATWPEFATCVGVQLDADGSVGVIAPHGLDDLFGMRVRHNPMRASAETFLQRVKSKRFKERWPLLSIEA